VSASTTVAIDAAFVAGSDRPRAHVARDVTGPMNRSPVAPAAGAPPRSPPDHIGPATSVTEVPLSKDVKIKPLEDRVIVTLDQSEQTTASGLVIPDTAKEKPQQGTVVAVGPGKRSETTGDVIPLDVTSGDTVLFSKYGGTEVKVDGEEYLILSARDILGIVG
jgi:chaperonin GroES